ncbi:MAG: cysteine synthase family protein [Actinobacteria bacterium]|nr:cysteine synthase family protein [Actinomycetota bacterium]
MESKTAVLGSVLEAIGNTPIVELSRLTRGLHGRVLVKLDYFNPGFSKKDRVALQMIEEAEAQGLLTPGQTVVELTSGNAGTGFAIVCGVKGYPFVAVMSKGNSPERARMMRAIGAEVVLVDQLPDSRPGEVSGRDLELVEQATEQIVKERHAFRPDQFRLQGNFRAHYLRTGREFVQQAGAAIDAFCDIAGTGGTFGGCAAALKEHNPAIRCYVVEPEGAAALAGQAITHPNHRVQGAGYARPHLINLPAQYIDGYVTVNDAEATRVARLLAQREGIFAGFSTGANVAAALQLLQGPCHGQTIATLVNDSGLKYLSTDLWE